MGIVIVLGTTTRRVSSSPASRLSPILLGALLLLCTTLSLLSLASCRLLAAEHGEQLLQGSETDVTDLELELNGRHLLGADRRAQDKNSANKEMFSTSGHKSTLAGNGFGSGGGFPSGGPSGNNNRWNGAGGGNNVPKNGGGGLGTGPLRGIIGGIGGGRPNSGTPSPPPSTPSGTPPSGSGNGGNGGNGGICIALVCNGSSNGGGGGGGGGGNGKGTAPKVTIP